MELGLALHKSLSEIMAMPYNELLLWLAYKIRHGPFNASNWEQANICTTLALCHGAKRITPKDFLLKFGPEKQTDEKTFVAFLRGASTK